VFEKNILSRFWAFLNAGYLMMDDIYNNRILEFAGNIPLTGVLDDADASAEKHSRLCGSKLKVYLKVECGNVTAF
jgi:NifU-like protein involved in Fe-S cluster formation